MTGVKRYFVDSGHTFEPTSRIKEKQKIKECSYAEQACSNIAMQRIVDDHTNYMIRARPKCKMDGEISGHWSTSMPGRLYELLYEYPNMGDYKGRTGLSPPAAYPSTVGYRHI